MRQRKLSPAKVVSTCLWTQVSGAYMKPDPLRRVITSLNILEWVSKILFHKCEHAPAVVSVIIVEVLHFNIIGGWKETS